MGMELEGRDNSALGSGGLDFYYPHPYEVEVRAFHYMPAQVKLWKDFCCFVETEQFLQVEPSCFLFCSKITFLSQHLHQHVHQHTIAPYFCPRIPTSYHHPLPPLPLPSLSRAFVLPSPSGPSPRPLPARASVTSIYGRQHHHHRRRGYCLCPASNLCGHSGGPRRHG